MALNISFGFDCDVPRGKAFSSSKEGERLLSLTIKGLDIISEQFDNLQIPRSFFICGQFLDTLSHFLKNGEIKNLFRSNSPLVEIGSHGWSHRIIKEIPLRPDKQPLNNEDLKTELFQTNMLIDEILCPHAIEGFRPPLGHYDGLVGADEILQTIKELNFRYVSSDIRSKGGGINPPLTDGNNKPRQPYFYHNGLLEIPSHGWHDTAFGGKSKTPMFESPPETPEAIVIYYANLIEEANQYSAADSNFYLTVVMHPNEVASYADEDFFYILYEKVNEVGGIYSTYSDISQKYFFRVNLQKKD